MRLKLACQEHLVPGDTLEAKWEVLAQAGFAGIELHGRDQAFPERLPELQRAKRAGVPLPSVCLISDHFIGDFDAERRRDAIENMKGLLTTIAAVGGEGAVTPAAFGLASRALPPFAVPRSPEEDREVLLVGLAELAEHARAEGVLIYLEPLNRYEDHMLNRVEQAAELAAAVGSDHIKVLGDLFHMGIEEDDSAAAIRAAGPALAHVHLADSGRAHPGTGQFDYAPIVAALHEIGFDGHLAMECGIRGDVPAALAQVAAIFGDSERDA
jgi:sugar phosphate isomerase/epimerase